MSHHYEKTRKLLLRKNYNRCSICKSKLRDEALDNSIFTYVGYDSHRKLQYTSSCCQKLLLKVVDIGVCGPFDGVCGPFDDEEMLIAIKKHPLFNNFNWSV